MCDNMVQSEHMIRWKLSVIVRRTMISVITARSNDHWTFLRDRSDLISLYYPRSLNCARTSQGQLVTKRETSKTTLNELLPAVSCILLVEICQEQTKHLGNIDLHVCQT